MGRDWEDRIIAYLENKKSPGSMYVSLLSLPVGQEGVQLTFRVL